MRINIPRVVVPVSLAEYAPELQGQALHVWVNPPMEKLNEFRALVAQVGERVAGADESILRWYAEMWSQGPQDTQWTLAELRDIEAQDPAFLSWLIFKFWEARSTHLEHKKKS